MADEYTVNMPQLVLLLFLVGVAIRWFFFNGASPHISSGPSSTATLRARQADVERVQQMFPQFARRTIMWDLQRNGGNAAATIERILGGRGLETPPQTFQPATPNHPPPSLTSSINSRQAVERLSQPDLITRYNLAAKVEIETEGAEAEEGSGKARSKSAWSQSKSERQALLQRRREDMILDARRKMQAKVAAETRHDGQT